MPGMPYFNAPKVPNIDVNEILKRAGVSPPPQLPPQWWASRLAGELKARVLAAPALDSDLARQLAALIDSLPYYGNPDWLKTHRDALCNLLQVNLPNHPIAPKPAWGSGFGTTTIYRYAGPYSGYRDAFFGGVQPSPTAQTVSSLVQGVNGGLDAGWWGNYCVALLTDAVRKATPISIDTSKLTAALGNDHGALMPALAATCLGVFQTGFTSTATALNAIPAGKRQAAAALLSSEILAGQFTANINPVIAGGGPGATAAIWFLFNLWLTLKALGAADVEATITQAKASGLTVPNEVGPVNWWSGGYTSWFVTLSGADLPSGMITAGMPTTTSFVSGVGKPLKGNNETHENGYAQSLCIWGPLNAYKS